MQTTHAVPGFTKYQKFIIAVLAFLQFTIILDFMIMAPLGAVMMPALKMVTSQFGVVVSAYAFSAGASGLFAAGFADKFDRKKLLLLFYFGFVAINSSLQQIAGGVAAVIAGYVVSRGSDGQLEHFNTLGYIIVGTSMVTLVMMFIIHRMVPENK